MRSWLLFISSLSASVASVLSVVIPFCLFLIFYQGDLFIAASERVSSRGIEVVLYLTPIFLVLAWLIYLLIFRLLKKPKFVIEIMQIIKVSVVIFIVLICGLFLILYLDGALYSFMEAVSYLLLIYTLLLTPLFIGLMVGNMMYLVFKRKLTRTLRYVL